MSDSSASLVISDCVSTLIPIYNRPDQLADAVQSVLQQTHRPLEIIIIDDGSTDETPSCINRLVQAHTDVVSFIRQKNSGPGAARNAGLQQARGEFVQYLDSDDLIEPEKFEKQVAALRENPNAGVCYCITMRGDPQGGEMKPWARTADSIENIFPEFLMKRGWATLTPLWRRTVCDAIGPWGDFGVMEDWEHDLRAGMMGVKVVHVAEPLAIVRDHDGNRASGMDTGFTPELTREFFRAHRSIWQKMRERGLTDWSYLESFSRKMFWIARMCGERGLIQEAEQALSFAEEMMRTQQQTREIRMFRSMTRVFGWRLAVRFSESGRKFVRLCSGKAAIGI